MIDKTHLLLCSLGWMFLLSSFAWPLNKRGGRFVRLILSFVATILLGLAIYLRFFFLTNLNY
jgi:hypothetical protein